MKRYKLTDSGARGWFIGDFDQAVYKTDQFEVCYQHNPRGKPDTHIHKQITEITLVISGRQVCNGELFEAGDICILEPGDISQIEYLEDTQVITIKTPSIPSDKFML
jgi:hypothetical protein